MCLTAEMLVPLRGQFREQIVDLIVKNGLSVEGSCAMLVNTLLNDLISEIVMAANAVPCRAPKPDPPAKQARVSGPSSASYDVGKAVQRTQRLTAPATHRPLSAEASKKQRSKPDGLKRNGKGRHETT
mmetsp:Transcript_57505/g.178519  ORF Transcript_57505/g.178519 Transcript_57505/m.178519 type:complete len:128 (-) Transcript_57505:86-469(-)